MHLNEEENENFNLDNSLFLNKFESMLKTNKVFFFDSDEFEEIIYHYLDSGKVSLAKKALKIGLDQHPKSVGLKLIQVEMLINENKIELAEKLLNELYLIEPQNEEIYIQRAGIYSKRDQHEKAIEELNIALKYTEDLGEVYNLIGMEYLFIDNLELAKDNFIACLNEDSEEQSCLYNVVYCFEFLDQIEEAIAFLNGYINKNPYSEIAWHQLGRLYYSQHKYEDALKAFDFSTNIDDEFVGAFIEKGKSLEKLHLYKEAIESYNRTLELDDATSYALLRIGKCHEKLGDKSLALKFYNRTVHEDPQLDKGWIAITDFYIRQENYTKAMSYANKALSLDSQNSDYWRKFAIINCAIHNEKDAKLGYKRAILFGDYRLETRLSLSQLQMNSGDFKDAIQTLVQAVEYYPNESSIEIRLAGLHYLISDSNEAEFHLKTAIILNPEIITTFETLFPELLISKNIRDFISKQKKDRLC